MTDDSPSRDVQSRRADIAAAFDRDLDPLAEPAARFEAAGVPPFEPFQLYLDDVLDPTQPRPGTYDSYVRFFNQWCDHMAATGRYPACPHEGHVAAFIEHELDEKENAPSTVKGKLRILSRTFQYWCDDPSFPHTGDYNPFALAREKASFETTPQKKQHPMDVATVREHVQSVSHLRDRSLVAVGFKLGLRVTEVRNLKLAEVALDHETLQSQYEELGTHPQLEDHTNAVYVPSRHERAGNKSMRPRLLPLDDELRSLLTQLLLVRPDPDEPWVFLSKQRHEQLGKKAINRIWKRTFHPKYAATDQYRPVTSHYGRHFFCTYWRVQQDLNRERLKYMRGDTHDGTVQGAEPIDHYLHTYYRDIEDIYRERMFELNI